MRLEAFPGDRIAQGHVSGADPIVLVRGGVHGYHGDRIARFHRGFHLGAEAEREALLARARSELALKLAKCRCQLDCAQSDGVMIRALSRMRLDCVVAIRCTHTNALAPI